MHPDRRTQPYRRGAREPGLALYAMLRGQAVGEPDKRSGTNGAAPLVDAMRRRPKRRQRRPRPERPPR